MDITKNKSVRMLKAAAEGNYGVPAIVCYNMEQILSAICAAEAKQSPAMAMLFPHALHQYGLFSYIWLLKHDEQQIKYAASLPFDSIMIDISHYDLVDNLKKTKELTECCHARGIAVEAEAGRIEGGEDGLKDTGVLGNIRTTLQFMNTGIDFLAPSIGNVHGGHPDGPFQFEYDRLTSIKDAVQGQVQLVLHGTTDDLEVRQSVRHGVAKVNLNRHPAIWSRYLRDRGTLLPITGMMDEE
ncbi:aldolase [Mollisia scopiformis]|uniref:Fructose-bisphosphate aldolase n=1 Tax=Mollisia scopiformis TaxID=149040 RepID=A0A194XF30_MOLSC|nr:aldolase [Mollisia scopiformis]KUJ18773.1 aldolase [Mollisia scopiformis]